VHIELRIFKYKKFMLLLPGDKTEEHMLDHLFKRKKYTEDPVTVTATLQVDDNFSPYLRFEVT
jgi:hypothetical protein